MVDIRSSNIKVKVERREHPRLEFHCRATVGGINHIVTITDISLGGFFFELNTSAKLKMGQVVDVSMNLPTEPRAVRVKAKFVNQNPRGIGCAFVNLTPAQHTAVKNCFETFKDTIPLR